MSSGDSVQARPAPTPRVGWWTPGSRPPVGGASALAAALRAVHSPICLVEVDRQVAAASGGQALLGGAPPPGALPLLAWAPALPPASLGEASFRRDHGLRYAVVAGSMANGIASEALVETMGEHGMLGFFGSAGLDPARVEAAIDRLQRSLGDRAHGFNLIHSPNEPDLEAAVAALYLRRQVRRIEASAYLRLTLPLLRYRYAGIHRGPDGEVRAPNQVMAKVSRLEVARQFLAPAPAQMLAALVAEGTLTAGEAELAATLPVASDLTAEADSGGHTDNQAALVLPSVLALRDEMQARHGHSIRVGAAGGIATPLSTAAAFAMGAAYVVTGSVNQACLESGSSPVVREMLSKAGPADVTMAPAADMFEMGVQVQVLKWGTMFPVKARKLYELYRTHDSLESLPADARTTVERDYLRCTVEEAWASTKAFFERRDPRQVARGEADPKHRMALVFRSYLGQSSRWANAGDPTRRVDYQVWCGPAMGAFNEWVRGSFLESVDQRRAAVVAGNLLLGASVLTRAAWLRAQGVELPAEAARFAPLPSDELSRLLEETAVAP